MAAQLLIEEEVIRQVLPYGGEEADEDYGDNRVLPGFIDIHTHGAYGYDTNDARPEGLREWMRRIRGGSLILPTTVTQIQGISWLRWPIWAVEEGFRGCADFGDPF